MHAGRTATPFPSAAAVAAAEAAAVTYWNIKYFASPTRCHTRAPPPRRRLAARRPESAYGREAGSTCTRSWTASRRRRST
eukprot:9720979-Alexandrium_andersonii.AAC.1